MPDISKVTLPSGGTYDIKDAWARERIASGVNMTIVWSSSDYASSSAPSTDKRATIPSGVTVYYNNGASSTTGTLTASANTKGTFYLIYSKSQVGDNDTFDEYVTYEYANQYGTLYAWEKIGDTQISLSNTATVLGTGTSFLGSASGTAVASTTKYLSATASGTSVSPLHKYLSASASGTAVGKTTKYLSASASGTAVGADGTASAITGYSSTTSDTVIKTLDSSKKLVTTEANKSTWSFRMGTGDDSETLIISGDNGTTQTVATGSVTEQGTGDAVVTGSSSTATCLTGLGTPSTETVLKGVKVTAQPTVTLTANGSSGTGRITYVEALGTVTQPTITLTANEATGTGRIPYMYGVDNITDPTITLTANDSTASGRVQYVQSLGAVTNPTIAVAASPDIVTVYTP